MDPGKLRKMIKNNQKLTCSRVCVNFVRTPQLSQWIKSKDANEEIELCVKNKHICLANGKISQVCWELKIYSRIILIKTEVVQMNDALIVDAKYLRCLWYYAISVDFFWDLR